MAAPFQIGTTPNPNSIRVGLSESKFAKPTTYRSAKDAAAEKNRLVADYRDKFANPFKAAELGYIDEVIMPIDLRPKLIRALELMKDKRESLPSKKHGNIPL